MIPMETPKSRSRCAPFGFPGAVALLLVSLAVTLAAAPPRRAVPGIGSKARPFPDARAKILVFTDQLPTQMTEAQWRFIASHYVGTQKEPRWWTRRIRRLNAKFIVLHYQLAVGTGPAAFIESPPEPSSRPNPRPSENGSGSVHGKEWTNDFQEVTQNESWFMHDDQERRLQQRRWDWYLMDIRFAAGRPRTGFPAYWAASAVRRMRANENDGCFADSYTQDILIGQLQPSTPLFSDAEMNKRSWLPHLNAYGAWCASAFHQQPERFYYLPNLGGLVTTWDTVTDLAVGDGGMNEGFAAPEPGEHYSDEDWKLQMSRVLELASRRKILICQTAVDQVRVDHRWFVVGSYLLSKGRRSYLNMFEKSSLEWYPEYTLDLGPYLAEPQPDVAAYWRPGWKLFRRDYARGFVLVNPTGSHVTVPELGGTFHLVTASGGGAVGDDGRPPGSLATRPVTSVTVPGHSARVLLKVALGNE